MKFTSLAIMAVLSGHVTNAISLKDIGEFDTNELVNQVTNYSEIQEHNDEVAEAQQLVKLE